MVEPKNNYMAKQKVSFTLTPTAIKLLHQLCAKHGVSQAAIIEMAVRGKAEKENVKG